jgi:hypothetical protein
MSVCPSTADLDQVDRLVSFAPTGGIEMKEIAFECANYVFFLLRTLARVVSRVIGQLQRAYSHPGLTP